MAVKIKAVQRVNPQDVEAPQKYYARAVKTGSTDLKRLAKLVAMQCTVSRADCMAVLAALEDNIIMELQEGRIVHLGDLGSFQLGVRSRANENAHDVSSESVKKVRLHFRPGDDLKFMMNNLKFSKNPENG
jgi:predicted histone-like DNA-binding protein